MVARKRNLEIEIVADTSRASAALKGLGAETQTTSGKFKDAGKLIQFAMGTAAALAVRKFADDSINAFSELEQSVGGTEAVFGEASGVIDDFAKTSAQSIGLAEAEFRTSTTLIGGQLKRMTGDVDFAAQQSIILTQTAADLAATYGGTTKEAVEALSAAFRGEADPAERFNLDLKIGAVNAKAVELGLAKTTSKVDANARAQATLALIMEQGADAQGQFAREADTVAGKLQRQEAAAKDAQAAIGAWMAPFKVELAGIANDIVTIGDGIASIGGDNKGFGDLVEGFFTWAPVLGEVKRGLEGVAGWFADTDETAGNLAVTTQDVQDHASDLTGELDALRGATNDVDTAMEKAEPSADALAFQLEREGDAAKYAREELLKKRDALRNIHDPLGRVVRLNSDLVAAEQKVADAQKKGVGSPEYRQAVLDRADIIADLEDTLIELKSNGIDPTGAAARRMLEGLGIPKNVIDEIFAQFDALEADFEGRRFNMAITVPDIHAKPDGSWSKQGEKVFMHSGGIVPGNPGDNVAAVLQAGETVLPTHKGNGGLGGVGTINVFTLSWEDFVRKVRDAGVDIKRLGW